MRGENELLSAEKVRELEYFVLQHPQICHSHATIPTNGIGVVIVKVSALSGLILIQGNKATGLQEILSRNQPASAIPYWIDAHTKKGSFFNSQHRQHKSNSTSPFLDYMSVAEAIYKPENLNTNKNDRLARFDLYCGNYINIDGTTDAYNLLLYKHSKVIHTLFLQNRKSSKDFTLKRGKAAARWLVKDKVFQLNIPYSDADNVKRFCVVFVKDVVKKTGECRIIVNNAKGQPIGFVKMPAKPFTIFTSLADEVASLQHCRLKKIEGCIRYITSTLNCLKQ